MDKININPDFTLEEQLIIIVDKYISKRYHPRDKSFSYQLYLIFVGYHLKYFYPERIYSKSNRNIDNIMAILRELNSLVNYIDNNQEKAEEIYATVRAQYEMKVIEKELIHEVRVRTIRL